MLNTTGGIIKGDADMGIKQSSTLGEKIKAPVADGMIEAPDNFVEFVWRYHNSDANTGTKWQDYFTGFIATPGAC